MDIVELNRKELVNFTKRMCSRFAIFRAMTAPVLVSYAITGANKNK